MTLGEILSRTLRIYRQNWRVFLLLSLIIASLNFLIRTGCNTWLHYHQIGLPAKMLAISIQSIFAESIGTVIIEFFKVMLWPVFFIITVNAITGRKLALGQLLREAFSRPAHLATLSLLRLLIYFIIPAVPFLLLYWLDNLIRHYEFASPTAHPAGTGLISISYFMYLIVVFCLMISFELSVCAFVQENLTPWDAFKRGWQLANKVRGKMTIISIVIAFFRFCLLLPILIFEVKFPKIFPILKTGAVWGIPLKVLMHQIAFVPAYLFMIWIFPIALTLIYFDQRIRQEGITFAEIMRGPNPEPQHPTTPEKMNPDPLVDASGVTE